VSERPTVLFLCVHNAGRSQMARAFADHLSGGAIDVYSGGSEPAGSVNAVAVDAMAEVGIDITAERPRRWTDAEVRSADVVITMGCGDTCPVYPGVRYEDWQVADPHGAGMDMVRSVRDDVERRVRALLEDLGVAPIDA
jgi:arsenate reductase